MEQKIELVDRLITFAASIIDVSESLPRSLAADHVAEKLMKNGFNPLLTYIEAQHSASRQEFIDKLQVSANELRGTMNFLKVIRQKNWADQELASVIEENDHLIAIFVKSLNTARKNSIQ